MPYLPSLDNEFVINSNCSSPWWAKSPSISQNLLVGCALSHFLWLYFMSFAGHYYLFYVYDSHLVLPSQQIFVRDIFNASECFVYFSGHCNGCPQEFPGYLHIKQHFNYSRLVVISETLTRILYWWQSLSTLLVIGG